MHIQKKKVTELCVSGLHTKTLELPHSLSTPQRGLKNVDERKKQEIFSEDEPRVVRICIVFPLNVTEKLGC